LSKARHLKIGGIPAAAYVAGRLQIAGNDGAVHAGLLGDLPWYESGEVRVIRVIRGLVFGDLLPGEFGEVQLPASAVAVRSPTFRRFHGRAGMFGHVQACLGMFGHV
jgi:hypothetical protein